VNQRKVLGPDQYIRDIVERAKRFIARLGHDHDHDRGARRAAALVR
jgi:hypothetical protein